MQYEEALRAAGYAALDEALREMAAAVNPCLEVSEHSLTLGRTKLYVTEITRFRLIRQAWTASHDSTAARVSGVSDLRTAQALCPTSAVCLVHIPIPPITGPVDPEPVGQCCTSGLPQPSTQSLLAWSCGTIMTSCRHSLHDIMLCSMVGLDAPPQNGAKRDMVPGPRPPMGPPPPGPPGPPGPPMGGSMGPPMGPGGMQRPMMPGMPFGPMHGMPGG